MGGILPSFLGSIFDPFLDFSWTRICLFYGTFSISMSVLDPFSDDFLTVHLVTILPPFTSVELWSVIEPWLAGRRLVQGPLWVRALHIRRISTLLVFPFAIFFTFLVFGRSFSDCLPHIPGFRSIFCGFHPRGSGCLTGFMSFVGLTGGIVVILPPGGANHRCEEHYPKRHIQ